MKDHLHRGKQFLFYVILVCLPVIFFGLIYFISVIYRAIPISLMIKSNQRGWKGVVHKSDTELGFSPIPNSTGEHTFPIGKNIPMRYDKNGFRIPVNERESKLDIHPVMLFLGCSYTYGDGVYAEDTWPYIVGRYFNGKIENAGVCSYGLAQMLILAKRLVPVNKPDFLIVQYSTWLVDRGINRFAPTYFGKLPTPYFYEIANDIKIHPPVFRAYLKTEAIERYRNSSHAFSDFLSFVMNFALPMYFHDDVNMSMYNFKNIFFFPRPIKDRKKLTRYVYEQMAKVAVENGSKLIIVIINRKQDDNQVFEEFPPEAMVVDADKALLGNLAVVDSEHYEREYAIWRGSPPRMVDGHPNEKAHKIIGDQVVNAIKKSSISR